MHFSDNYPKITNKIIANAAIHTLEIYPINIILEICEDVCLRVFTIALNAVTNENNKGITLNIHSLKIE